MAERSIVDREVAGSSPVVPASFGSVAQRQSIRLLSEGLRVQVSPDPLVDCGLRISDCGFRIADFELRIADFGFRIEDLGFRIADLVRGFR